MDTGRVVTVFGSARVAETSPHYQEAYHLGKRLAERGYVVCNGGYDGAMAAVSRGAKDGGGRTIGVTVDLFANRLPNDWIDDEKRSATLFHRLEVLTEHGDAYVGVAGGAGTLLEVALVWNLALISGNHHKPIVLIGPEWCDVIERIADRLVVGPADLAHLHLVNDVDAAIGVLDQMLGQ